MMPTGYGRNVDSEHHLSKNSECGVVGYSGFTRLTNNNNRENLLLLFIIYLFPPISRVQSVSFASIKSKASGIKINPIWEYHDREGSFSDKLVLQHRLKASFRCVNLYKKPSVSGPPLPSHLVGIKCL